MADVLAPDIKNILLSSEIDENTLRLTCGDLGDTYKKVDAILKRCGGKWNTKQACHVFARGTDVLRVALDTNKLPPINPLAFFPTPIEIAETAVARLDAYVRRKTLEPSAGHGVFAKMLRDEHGLTAEDMDLIEYDPFNCAELRSQGFNPIQMDFMNWNPGYKYKCVIMNPPFSLPGDPIAHITHFLHAYDMWEGGGNMVAIVPPTHILNWCFGHERTTLGTKEVSTNPRIERYQRIIEESGHTELLPKNSFRQSGTNVDTAMVLLLG